MEAETAGQIQQLEQARKHVLADAHHYLAIIPGILPIISPNSHLDIRRWGADFLAEGFASPALATQTKETLSVKVLPLLKDLLDAPGQDEAVVKSVIQTAASIFPLVFRYITKNPRDTQPWELMSVVKSNILKRWDSTSMGIRVCCIKFVQRVVHVQTPGVIADPRRPDQSEISLAIVPRDHPVIPPSNLEAESAGLLDRLLNVFLESDSNPILIDATLNCLMLLVRSRQSIANKIIGAVLNFNPLKNAKPTLTPGERVVLRSTERNTRLFLVNIIRRNENAPIAVRLKHHVDRMLDAQMEFFDEGSRKRGAPDGPDALENAKRARLGLPGATIPAPLPPGPVSVAQLYTLTTDNDIRAFDVNVLPLDIVIRLSMAVLQNIDSIQLDETLQIVRSRYGELSRRPAPAQPTAADEDDYEPEFEPAEDREQVLNKLDMAPPEGAEDAVAPDLAIGAFKLPQPPPVTAVQAMTLGQGCIGRVWGMMNQLEEPDKTPKPGFSRLAASRYDREAWVTVSARLATRAYPDFVDEETEGDTKDAIRKDKSSLGDGIRETLWKYVVDDFRHRIDVGISWLNEEWYNDKITSKWAREAQEQKEQGLRAVGAVNYEKWTLRLLDAIVPYLDAGDKLLVRFVGEVPEITEAIMGRIKNMAKDPDRIALTVKAIYYLIAFKPPAKVMAIDALEDIYRNYVGAKAFVRPYLVKVRPAVVAESAEATPKDTPPASGGSTMAIDTSAAVPQSPSAKPEPSPSAITAAG